MFLLKLLTAIVLLVLIAYLIHRYISIIRLLNKNEAVLFPKQDKEFETILSYNQAVVTQPKFEKQKLNLVIMGVIIIIVIIISVFILTGYSFNFYSIILLLLVPFLYMERFMNLFAFTKEGLWSGDRLIRWEKIIEFQLIRINMNHKYYGYSKNINDKYELKIKIGKLRKLSYIITSDETKDHITEILKNNAVAEVGE
ncbi:hypothetical protein [Bacillus solimangrovi]|uniref:DUF5673 domain-containing protein n=1 Tax=Bacillus solimangrovi TaxID=1305675 RepID=A0A1E5LER1_9BACI|nr:hypothetical protein [Bacillus solimangrovi]OEH92556.1 hypothetical protein BFG57_15195 [Bacillus solimangrovi]